MPRVLSTRMFCRCPDCNRPVKRNEGDLYRCHKCPVGGSQLWSDTYLRAYWRGVNDGKRQNDKVSDPATR
jgi:hypothetical protein